MTLKPSPKIVTITLNPAIDISCTVPSFSVGQVNRIGQYQRDAAGKGINISKILRLYDYEVTATGFLGDQNLYLFDQMFTETSIQNNFITVQGQTRYNFKLLDPVSHLTTDLNFASFAPTKADCDAFLISLKQLCQDATHVILAGSCPPALSNDFFSEMRTIINSKNIKFYLDSSGNGLKQLLPTQPYFAKPNLAELEEFMGHKLNNLEDIIQAGKSLLATGVTTLAISLGENGALYFHKNEILQATPPMMIVKSTVGAGDAMVAGCLISDFEGLSLAEMAAKSMSLSLATLTVSGPTIEDLKSCELYPSKITFKQLSEA